jgi:hypothetical protein
MCCYHGYLWMIGAMKGELPQTFHHRPSGCHDNNEPKQNEQKQTGKCGAVNNRGSYYSCRLEVSWRQGLGRPAMKLVQ